MRAALAFLAGDSSTAVSDAHRAGLMRYALQDGPGKPLALHRCLGLPATPAGVRRELRNAALMQAATHLVDEIRRDDRHDGDDTLGAVAQLLADAADTLERVKWSTWQLFTEPPAHADAVDRALWRARQLNGKKPLPTTPRQFENILVRSGFGEVFPESTSRRA